MNIKKGDVQMGNNKHKWTLEKLHKEAMKFNSKTEFKEKSRKAFYAASKRGLLSTICSHMKATYKQWDENSVFAEAQKYQKRSDFKKTLPVHTELQKN